MTPGCDHDAIVVGAGPSGLLLAAELRRHGLDVAVLEQRPEAAARSRAIGVHAPTLAALEVSGATERILAEALRLPRGVARTRSRILAEVRFDRRATRFPFVATVPQAVTEAAVAVGGPAPLTGARVVAIDDEGDRVRVRAETASGSRELTALVVAIAAGPAGRALAPVIARVHVYPDRYLMADVDDADGAPRDAAVVTLDASGVLESFPLPGGRRRVVAWDGMNAREGRGPGADVARLRQAVAERTGDEALAANVDHASAFGIRRVLVDRMRAGRVVLLGDAAHEVSPIGGQGMNLGLLDAATLAPVLARWVRAGGDAPAGLAAWERRRLASARTAARLASVNTAIGRRRPWALHDALPATLGVALGGPLGRVPARAYAMGFDRDA